MPENAGDLIPAVPDAWQMSEKGRRAVEQAAERRALKHGFYAHIPIICRGERCPYRDTCFLIENDMAPEGERCPLEIAEVQDLFAAYVSQLNIDPENVVDLSLVKELVDLEVSIVRCDNKLASDGDFIQEVPVGVTPKGMVITKPELHLAVEYKDRLLERRHRILQLLNATRKDKVANKFTVEIDPSSRAAEIMARAREVMADAEYLDVEFDERDEVYAVRKGGGEDAAGEQGDQ